MNKSEFLSKNAGQTKNFAKHVLRSFSLEEPRKKALIIALVGELGSGKTTFTQGLAKALGVKEKITSPTFVILKRFAICNKQFANLYHIDCYRLEKPSELRDLLKSDFNNIFTDPKNLIVIEWADKVKSLMPKNAVWVGFEWKGKDERIIIVK